MVNTTIALLVTSGVIVVTSAVLFKKLSRKLEQAVKEAASKADDSIRASEHSAAVIDEMFGQVRHDLESIKTSFSSEASNIASNVRRMKNDIADIRDDAVHVENAVFAVEGMCNKATNSIDKSLVSLGSAINSIESLKSNVEDDLNNIRVIHIDAFQKVKQCLAGIDQNTRDLLVKLRDAIDKNDVEKLAEVVRAADALANNYDAVNKVINSNLKSFNEIESWVKKMNGIDNIQPAKMTAKMAKDYWDSFQANTIDI